MLQFGGYGNGGDTLDAWYRNLASCRGWGGGSWMVRLEDTVGADYRLISTLPLAALPSCREQWQDRRPRIGGC